MKQLEIKFPKRNTLSRREQELLKGDTQSPFKPFKVYTLVDQNGKVNNETLLHADRAWRDTRGNDER